MSRQDRILILVQRIKRSGSRGAQQKQSSTVSSNISSGFKRDTGGKDYKLFYDDTLRSPIASWGAKCGVPIPDIVDLVVAMRDYSMPEKVRIIDDITQALGGGSSV